MSMKLSLDSLTVQSFSTGPGLTFAAAGVSKNYSECDSCGIACTAIDCPVPSANYSECDSCGIACTAIDCPVPSAQYTDCGSCGIACTSVQPC